MVNTPREPLLYWKPGIVALAAVTSMLSFIGITALVRMRLIPDVPALDYLTALLLGAAIVKITHGRRSALVLALFIPAMIAVLVMYAVWVAWNIHGLRL